MSSKPMSDGGKGSVRRNEDNDAYQRGWDSIFGNKKKEKEQPMMNDDPQERSDEDDEQSESYEEDDSEWTCDLCGGPMYSAPHWRYGQCDDCGARQELINDDYI